MDIKLAQKRCLRLRKRILDLSQNVSAMHIAPAFSCLEIIDSIYFGLMDRQDNVPEKDTFVLSKGHGCMSQYVILEELGILPKDQLDFYCTPQSFLGGHPDYGTPGIEASTGSLGHGLSIAFGMAYAEKLQKRNGKIFVVLGDGEMQEGSVWEAMMMAPNLKLDNLIAFIDLNNYQGLGKTSETHPNFYPIVDKCRAFGWETMEVNGHSHKEICAAVKNRLGKAPTMLVCHTIKGKGVDYMIDSPIWHYRSPNVDEYAQAVRNLKEIAA
jgi:transketolase